MKFRDKLSAAELRHEFETYIRPTLDLGRAGFGKEDPTLVLLGGQPGAGKTRSAAIARREHPGAVAVIGDDFRANHPDYERVMRDDPLRMPEVTAQAASAWARMSSEYLRDQRASVVFETTFRQPDAVVATATQFREAGYRVEVRALAVPEAVSRLGVLTRYAEQVREAGAGRWTPKALHDAAAEQMPKSLERVTAAGLVDRVIVVNRAGERLHETAPGTRPDAAASRAAVDAGRRLDSLVPEAARDWLVRLDRDATLVLGSAQRSPDVLDTIDELRRDGHQIADRAHAPGTVRNAAAHTALDGVRAKTDEARAASSQLRAESSLGAGLSAHLRSPGLSRPSRTAASLSPAGTERTAD